MAKSKTHDNLIYLTTPLIVIGSTYVSQFLSVNQNIYIPLMTFMYIAGGLYLSPDLDIVSTPYNRWHFLKFIWLPYQKWITHRSIFSHGLIIGTIIRLLYLSFIIGVLAAAISYNTILSFYLNLYNFLSKHYVYSLSSFIFIELSSICHIIADLKH